jgi:hypothetical protein
VSSNSSYTDDDGETNDWIEFYNPTDETINLKSWYLSDEKDDLKKWQFPDIQIKSGEFLIVFASDKNKSSKFLHTNFKISSKGETLFLSNENEELTDEITIPLLLTDVSYGISITNDAKVYYSDPTPGYQNSINEFLGITDSVLEFSHPGGIVDDKVNLSINGIKEGETIRYTTDKSVPKIDSQKYDNPIIINETKVIRAKIFKEDYISNYDQSKTFIFNANHSISIVSLVSEPDNFFSEESGIYVYGNNASSSWPYFGANFWNDWERSVHFSYYEKDNKLGIEFNAGVKIFGGTSRSNDQRSLSIFARNKYGLGEIDYPFFDNVSYDKFQSIILRNTGNDWIRANMRDAAISKLMQNSDLEFQDFNPVATYLNGEYWGLYFMREKINEHMISSKSGIDPDDISLLEFDGEVIHGSNDDFMEFRNFVYSNDLDDENSFEYVKSKIDIDNFILYNLTNIYIGNNDWPGNNRKFWRGKNGKWRWILFDTDFAFGLEAGHDYSFNSIAYATDSNCDSPSCRNRPWSTVYLRKLLKNNVFKNKFINRFADEINTRFLPENINSVLQSTHDLISSEINSHFSRWKWSPSRAVYYLNLMKNYVIQRPSYVKNHILEYFSISNFHRITINNNQIEMGEILLNDNLKLNDNSWSGDYFEDVLINIKAIPKIGYEFSHWSGDMNEKNDEIELNPNSEIKITANFVKSNLSQPIINEINYKSSKDFDSGDWLEIYNPNDKSLDLSNWYVKDDDNNNIYIFPEGTLITKNDFLVVVSDTKKFKEKHESVLNFIGNFDFGLGKSDSVRLYNQYDQLVDFVNYSNKKPWTDCADGTGNTLELIKPSLDNSLSENWNCNNKFGSPGLNNNFFDNDGDGIVDVIDNCINTPNIDQADLDGDGIGDVCDDDKDGDTILNDKDNCPLTANTDQADADGDNTGDVCDDDDDNDKILDENDDCPNTPAGSVVDVKGCPIFSLPFNNNKVEVTSASCIGNADGIVKLTVIDNSFDYNITFTGKDYEIAITGENKTATVTGLSKGDYTVCFKVTGQADYEQCFDVTIGEPKALSAFIDVDNDNRSTTIQLGGSNHYNVDINGERFKVTGDNFTSSLKTGLNSIRDKHRIRLSRDDRERSLYLRGHSLLS